MFEPVVTRSSNGVVPIRLRYRVFPLQTAFDGSMHCCTYDTAVTGGCGRARPSDIREAKAFGVGACVITQVGKYLHRR